MTITNEEAPLFGSPRERSFSDGMNSPHNPSDRANSINKMTTTTKKYSNPHPQRHHGNHRPRSKSCDRYHRHSSTHVRKKKCSTKSIPGTHSPIRRHVQGRMSPKTLSHQQVHGRLWIRPVPVRRVSFLFKPVSASIPPQVEEARGNHTFAPISPKENPLVSRVAGSSIYDKEMIWVALGLSPNSSFNSHQLQRHGRINAKNSRIVFGQSGKPIRPRNAF
mmetsp:Transcript_30632/g.56144  ORF Transcript_30632/g.56144 Transcript_30632/m.56144 type:complete len:220 (-) Transcript_30632:750-1409(-)|eukprot:CAMPEP_0201629956 /NCGR_PEP_ID=MMETSP0493-20130528/4439_1 /ASSEMBLY_ACC=CAM_ASM_000838 /TAXON_ID=420259 /ORGANISM="Thalassiosira gravida, Strain GMp14c1" /LENGTH=219 /DNA_ID=CAMNT_0048101029 /DNA_START=123 /DNA_END=782 /DNA_ORIENTATION=+